MHFRGPDRRGWEYTKTKQTKDYKKKRFFVNRPELPTPLVCFFCFFCYDLLRSVVSFCGFVVRYSTWQWLGVDVLCATTAAGGGTVTITARQTMIDVRIYVHRSHPAPIYGVCAATAATTAAAAATAAMAAGQTMVGVRTYTNSIYHLYLVRIILLSH